MSRFITIDSFRGLLLVVMTVNHLPGPHRSFTYDQIGYFTAAEGFVFISGLVAGLHGYKLLLEAGEGAMRGVFYRRAGLLYGSQMVLLGVLFLLGLTMQMMVRHLAGAEKFMMEGYAGDWSNLLHPLYADPGKASVAALLLLYQPPLFDVLPMYCLFLFFTPFILCGMQRKKGWLIFCSSLLLWFLAQLQGLDLLLVFFPVTWGIHHFVFDPVAWQILFVLGVLSGSFWRLRRPKVTPDFFWLAGSVVLVLIGFSLRHAPVALPVQVVLGHWSDRESLAPLRLFSSLALLNFFALFALRFPQLFTWPILARLGRNSLWIFLYQIALVYVCGFWCDHILAGREGSWLNLLVIAVVTSTLWLAAACADQIKIVIKGEPGWLADRLFCIKPVSRAMA